MDILAYIEVSYMNKMISISKVSILTGVTIKTLKIWGNENRRSL